MAELKGTQVAASIVPFTDLDTYATHDAEYGKGGFRSVSTIEDRDAIPVERKTEGMIVRVTANGLNYEWKNNAWVEWLPKGNIVIDTALSETSTNPVQNKVIATRVNTLEDSIVDILEQVNNIPIITVDTVWNATSNNPASSRAIESTISPIRTTANAAIPKRYIDTTLDDSASDTRVPSTKLLNTITSTLVAGIQKVQDSADSAYDKANAAIPKSNIISVINSDNNKSTTLVTSPKAVYDLLIDNNSNVISLIEAVFNAAQSALDLAGAAIPKSKIDTGIDGTETAHDAVPSVAATVTYVKSQRTAIDGSINSVSGRVTTLETWKNGIGNKNQANGVAGLDASGKISASQLPAGYDNVDKLVAFVANAPTSGMTIGQKWYITSTKKIFTATSATSGSVSDPIGNDMIYIDQNANKSYYWTGTDMVNIGSGNALALGTTSSTAFRGDYGNILYTNFGTGTNLTGTQDARDCFAKLKRDFGSAGNASVIKTLHVNTYSNNIILQDDILYFNGEQNNGDGFEIPAATTSKAGVMTADMYKTFQEMELATFPLTLNIVPSSDSIFEVGASYTPTINISVSRKGTNVTSGSNINVVGVPTLSGSISSDKQTWIPTSAVRANQKLTVTATYGSQSASKVYNVFFKYKKYWGVSTNASLTSAQVLTLGNSTWADSKAMGATTFDCTGGKYVYYVVPSSVGVPEFWVGGLKNSDVVITNANVTNASGGTTTYQIMRLTNIQTGVLSIQFK